MVTAELLSFIEQETAQGVASEVIREQLKNGGWQEVDIEQGFIAFAKAHPPVKSGGERAVQAEVEVSSLPTTVTGAVISKKKRKVPKLFFIVGGVLLLCIVALSLPMVLGLLHRDVAQVSDTDLLLPPVQVKEAENAYFDLVEAVQQGKVYESASATPVEKEAAVKAMFLAYAAAAKKPYYQDPAIVGSTTSTTSTLSPEDLQKVARSINVFATQVARTSSSTDGLSLAVLGAVIGTKIEKSQDTSLAYELAMNIKTESLQAALHIATSTTQKSEELIDAAHRLAGQATDGTGLVTADKVGYQKYRALLLELNAQKAVSLGLHFFSTPVVMFLNATGYVYQPYRTVSALLDTTRARIEAHSETCEAATERPALANTGAKAYLISFPAILLAPNSMGAYLLSSVASSPYIPKAKECDEEVLRGGVELVLALKAFEQDNKALPKTLAELVPTYIPTVPHGPYHNASTTTYRYDPVRRTVYSLGAGGVDKGGNVPENPTYSF